MRVWILKYKHRITKTKPWGPVRETTKRKDKKMKKIILTLVAVLSMTNALAENESMNMNNAYAMNVNYGSLSRALNLSDDQLEAVKDIHSAFNAAMINAASADADDAKAIIASALDFDLREMRAVLENDQFRKYITILNATFNNRGLNAKR